MNRIILTLFLTTVFSAPIVAMEGQEKRIYLFYSPGRDVTPELKTSMEQLSLEEGEKSKEFVLSKPLEKRANALAQCMQQAWPKCFNAAHERLLTNDAAFQRVQRDFPGQLTYQGLRDNNKRLIYVLKLVQDIASALEAYNSVQGLRAQEMVVTNFEVMIDKTDER